MDKNKIEFINKLISDKNKKEQTFSKHRNIITNGNMVPIEVADEMVSNIPEWVITSSTTTFLIPFCGTGSFVISVMKRLLIYHSIENSLNRIYICEKSLSTSNFFLKNTYNNKNIYLGTIMDDDFNKIFNKKFTCVITNPPYNSERNENNSSKDIYPEFVDKAFELADRYVIMITKSNWMTKPTKKSFRDKMIKDYNVDKIIHYKNNPFTGTDISGGVSYFVIDNENTKDTFELNGVVYDRNTPLDFLPYEFEKNELSLLKSFNKLEKLNLDNLRTPSYYTIGTNDNRLINSKDGDVYVCHVSEQKGKIKFLPKEHTNSKIENDIDKYKIFTTSAYGANPYGMGRILKGHREICSASLINWIFDTEKERDIFYEYMNTKTFRVAVSLVKNKKHVYKNVFSLVPHIDFSKLEKVDDENIYKYLNLTEEDMQTIEERCERLKLIKK